VEDGRADVIVCAYFDRLVRSLDVQLEVVKRVEQAGGKIIAVDVGHVTNGTAALRLSSNMIGAVAEYHRGELRRGRRPSWISLSSRPAAALPQASLKSGSGAYGRAAAPLLSRLRGPVCS
jgi:DNA invertase Pin-like site-specific DNA recombinase